MFVLEVDDKYFDIDSEVKLVLNILSESYNYQEATASYIKETKEDFTEEDFTYYAEELLKKFNLDKKQTSFLLVEKVILSPSVASKLADTIKWLFQPSLFWITFVGLIIFSIYITFFFETATDSESLEIKVVPFFLWYFVTIIFHELGHVAACKKFTGKNGGMGIGIYIIYPVFFSNISAIWHATKREKIIANLAGIYMQLWFVPIFLIYGIWSNDHFFVDFSQMLIFISVIQILPFVRSDGYWLLSDIFNVSNLLSRSQANIKVFLKNPITFLRLKSNTEMAILTYGLINTVFILFFAYYQLVYNFDALLDFPFYIWKLILEVYNGNVTDLQFEAQYVMVMVFYYLVFTYSKLLIKYIKETVFKI